MKNTLLKLNKTLLIVEAPAKFKGTEIINDYSGVTTFVKIISQNDGFWLFPFKEKGKLKFICEAHQLTEEIASKYVENFCADMNIPAYRNYAVKPEDLEDDHWAHVANDAVESLTSAIEASGSKMDLDQSLIFEIIRL